MSIRRSCVATFLAALVLCATSPVYAGGLDDFGRCLGRSGATFYGASWCPHCRAQRETLGDAMRHVRYVECAVEGGHETTFACKEAQIKGYPTWVFSDGSRAVGEQTLDRLAAKTGCDPPGGRASTSTRTRGESDVSVHPHGPKIIEVP